MMRRLLMRLPGRVRLALRRTLVALVRIAGSLGLPMFARGKLPASEASFDSVQRALGGIADCSQSFIIEEPTPATKLVSQHGPDIRPRPTRTLNLVVDAADPEFSFRNNVALDHRRRVIAEQRSLWDELPVAFSRLERTERYEGTVAYLSNTNVGNFAHWITLTLPLLRIYWEHMRIDPDAYYVGSPIAGWHLETLDMLGIPEDRVFSHGVTADRLVVAISNRLHGAVDTPSLHFVRERLGRPRFAGARSRRLFVGRGNVEFRRFINESECSAILTDRYGFEYVTMDGKTVEDEIELFSSAECIVGVHGAALTNLLWAHPDCRVLELVPYGWTNPHYQELAAFVGCPYGYIVGRADAPRAAGPDEPPSVRRENDVLVDPTHLISACDALGF